MLHTINGISVDDFTYHYLCAALWSTHISLPVCQDDLVDGCMDVPEDHPLHGISEQDNFDDHFDLADLSDEAVRLAIADCTGFQEKHADDLLAECDEQSGHDFWLTRNEHGAGFWDRDYADGDEDKGDRLSAGCGWKTDYPTLNPWVDNDGRIHFDG